MRTGRLAVTPVLFPVLLLGSALPAARAQCESGWIPQSTGLVGTTCGDVYATTTWDPDGDGPAAAVLVVGGRLSHADDQLISNVSTWDGAAWAPLGGLETDVNALVVFRGQLIASGSFGIGTGSDRPRGIALWTGSEWAPLGSGTRPHASAAINALAVINDRLYAVGTFESIDGVICNNIAAWDGAAWHSVGGGTDGEVRCIASTSAGIVIGGDFTHAGPADCNRVAIWDGLAWQPMGAGVNNSVYTACEFGGEILIGGFFTSSISPTRRMARWHAGAWEEFGGGASFLVSELTVQAGTLFASGTFRQIGGTPAQYVASWDGAAWHAIPAANLLGLVFGVTAYGDQILTFGQCGVVARQASGDWERLGATLSRGAVATLDASGDALMLGGNVRLSEDEAFGLMQFDGLSWEEFSGIPGVRAISRYAGQLIVGGSFPGFVQRWNGSAWLPLGAGVDGPVFALGEYGGDLIVGGEFRRAGSVDTWGVARWTGADWQPMGAGLPLTVYTLKAHHGELYAGGSFWVGANPLTFGVARWDGAAWQSVGGGTNGGTGIVSALESYNDELVASGYFLQAGGAPVNHIASWDGDAWRSLGTGTDAPVLDLTVFDDQLIAGGFFENAGGAAALRLARWNGTEWSAFPGEINGPVHSVTVFDGDLHVGGAFTQVDGRPMPFWVRWGQRPDGDLDGDRVVGLQDLAALLAAFGACPGDANYNAFAGMLAGSSCVELADLAILLHSFGTDCP